MSEPNMQFIQHVTTPAVTTRRQHRPLRIFLWCVMIFSLMLNVVIVTVMVYNVIMRPQSPRHDDGAEPEQEALKAQNDRGTICFSCQHLGPGIQSNDTVYDIVRDASGAAFCCLSERSPLKELFMQIIIDEYRAILTSSTSGGHFGFIPTVHDDSTHQLSGMFSHSQGAHLYMKPVKDGHPQWTPRDTLHNTAYCSGVICGRDSITIQRSGMYLVYSQITFKRRHPHRHSYNTFIHAIQRKNNRFSVLGEQPVLFSKVSLRTTAGPQKYSFLSAILQLRRNDVIRVTLSEDYSDFLDTCFLSNFFGVLKV